MKSFSRIHFLLFSDFASMMFFRSNPSMRQNLKKVKSRFWKKKFYVKKKKIFLIIFQKFLHPHLGIAVGKFSDVKKYQKSENF